MNTVQGKEEPLFIYNELVGLKVVTFYILSLTILEAADDVL